GLPRMQVLVQTVLHAGLRRGDAEEVDPTISGLLGRPPRTMREYVHDRFEPVSGPGTGPRESHPEQNLPPY
ncbi:MAG: hypothetical protein JO181_03155, partial [Solirubrobacterales bacterium]|nr:hypothetical protein [Solirubrobacterales bacterium]